MSNGERDQDGFPVACAENVGTLFVDEFEVVWVCVFEDHPEIQEYVWRTVGRK